MKSSRNNFSGGVFVGVVDDVGDGKGDNFSEADDGKTDESIEDGLFGFLEFTGIAGGSDVADAAVDYENCRNYTADTDSPLNGAGDNIAGVVLVVAIGAFGDAFRGEVGAESNANGSQNGISGYNDGKTDEGVSKGFFAVGDFAWVAA